MADKNKDGVEEEIPQYTDETVAEYLRERQDRIAVRRARIGERLAKRNEALKEGSIASSADFLSGPGDEGQGHSAKSAGGDSGTGESKSKREGREYRKPASDPLDIQIDESRKQLEQIILDGENLITNVRIAAEGREKVRHIKQSESRKERLERLKKEADDCQQMYEELKPNFNVTKEKKLPTDLFEAVKNQMQACEELLMKKQDLINSLQQDLEESDFQYEQNLEMYQKDVSLIGDRIDDCVDEMQSAFLNELGLIEDYTCRNREVLLEENQREWMDLLEDFETMEETNLAQRKKDALNKFQALNELYVSVKQECRANRHKYEDDLRILIQELEQIKYATQLNMEKLQYNLAIIRKRYKENVEMKNMMKRLLLKFNDRFTSKSRALKMKMEAGRKEAKKILGEIAKLEESLDNFGKKTLHLAVSDWNKYMDLWTVSEEIVRDKVQRLLDSEQYIFETQLGIDSPMPDLSWMEERPDVVTKHIVKKSSAYSELKNPKAADEYSPKTQPSTAVTIIEKDKDGNVKGGDGGGDADKKKALCKTSPSLIIMPTDSIEFVPGPEPDLEIQRRLMKHVAKVICDESDFLVEEELRKLVEPLMETERNLINLDALLKALGINSVEEMQYLAHFILRRCRVTKGIISRMGSKASAHLSEMNVSLTGIMGKNVLDDWESQSGAESDHSGSVSAVGASTVTEEQRPAGKRISKKQETKSQAGVIDEVVEKSLVPTSVLVHADEEEVEDAVTEQPPAELPDSAENDWQDDEQETTDSQSSVVSQDSSSNLSDEFMYIEPDEVIEALTTFCKEYNAKITVQSPTLDELIDRKLANFKYPKQASVYEYWERSVKILGVKGDDMWDGMQYSFEEFNTSLKKRNDLVDEVLDLYKRNYELSFLMQNHLATATQRFLPKPTGSGLRTTTDYC